MNRTALNSQFISEPLRDNFALRKYDKTCRTVQGFVQSFECSKSFVTIQFELAELLKQGGGVNKENVQLDPTAVSSEVDA